MGALTGNAVADKLQPNLLTKLLKQAAVTLCVVFLIALTSVKLFARAPFMSYASPKTYVAGTAITSLSPTGRLVAAPGYSSRTTKLGSGFNSPEGVEVDATGDLFMADDRNISYTTSATAACPSLAKKNHGYDFTQFYSVALHTTSANYVVDWTQDNGAQQFTSTGMNPTDYVTGGNGANTFIDQAKGNIPRTSYVYNNLGGESYFNYGYPSVFETKNTTTATPVWTLVEGNLPDMPGRRALFYPSANTKAIIATELGVWSTDLLNDASTVWSPTNSGLANVEVDMLKFRASNRPLAAAAHGGGLFTTILPVVSAVSSDATLSHFIISSGTLTPVFAAGITNYTASVSNATASITITPTTGDANATVKVNGVTVASGSASPAFPLSVGTEAIRTVVTAQDGVTTQTYTLTITRISNNAALSNIKVSPATTLTGAGGLNYITTVRNSESTVKITATAQSRTATIKINGVTVASGTASAAIPLNVGDNVINIVVTAQDGVTTKTYSIKFTRLPPPSVNLASFAISSGTLSPVFAADTTSYTATVGTATITVTPATSDADLIIKVNGTTVASGTASPAFPLIMGDNVITTVVTSNDGITTKTYTLKVTRVSNNAALTSLKINPSTTLTGAGGLNYTTTVPNTEASVQITATAQNTTATIKINGVTVASGTASAAIPLNVGDNVINTVVTARDGVTVKTYSIKFTRLSAPNATLANLVLSRGTLTPVFASGTTIYTASVSNATASITVTPTTSNAGATIKVNGTTVASGTASAALPLVVGPNTITTVVTAPDGIASQTYTLTITRISNNAALSSIKITPPTTLTGAGGLNYTTTVPNTEASVQITATAQSPTAIIKINGVTVASGTTSAAIPLNVGDNVINTVVTAQDGVTVKTYSIKFTRLSAPNATLANLVISSGTLTPVFASGTTIYTASVNNATASITVRPTTSNAGASVKVNGTTVASGTASAALPLLFGPNIITTVVTAPDGVTTQTYKLTVTRVSNSPPNLYSIKLAPATTLIPMRAEHFKTTVPYSESTVKITAIAESSTANMKINGVTVTSGTASAAIPLNVGDRMVYIVLTADDGVTTKTYSIKFTRLPPPSASLASLTISSGTLSPVFATGIINYTASVSNATASVTVTPTVLDATATIKVNGTTVASGSASAALPLVVGPNIIRTVVTAQDGVTSQTYTLTITRISNNAALSSIKITPPTTLTGAGGLNYTTTVPNTEASVQITATAQSPTAIIKINGVTVASGAASAAIPLNVGDNVISTVVTAQDGVTVKTYSIKFTRLSAPDAALANLVISSGTLTPVFASGTTIYTASVSSATASITVTPTTSNAGATVKVNGTAVASGTASAALPLVTGPNTITTVATAPDGITTQTYRLTVTRISNNAALRSLEINSSTLLTGAGGLNYTTTVPSSESTVKITPTTQDATATVKVNGVTVASGTASGSIALNVGTTVVNTVVTAQDGVTTKTYSITFTRPGPIAAIMKYDQQEQPINTNSIAVHRSVSPNGDGISDVLIIDGITAYPENKLQIMSRSGVLIYEAKGYDNDTKVFDGHSTNGKLQKAGTYFYSLEYKDGNETKHKAGFIVLKY